MNEDKFVYKLKSDIDLNELAKLDYDVATTPDGNIVFFKIVPQDVDGELVKMQLEQVYENPKWISMFYKKHRKELRSKLGLSYKNDKAIMTNKFKEVLTNWRIQIEPSDDGWIGFKSYDRFDNTFFYGKNVLDKYCGEEIKKLKESELIEEFDATDF